MTLRRSLEIAHASKDLFGVLETFRKLLKRSLQLQITLKCAKGSLTQ